MAKATTGKQAAIEKTPTTKTPDPMTAAARAGDVEHEMSREEASIRGVLDGALDPGSEEVPDAALAGLIERAERAAGLDAVVKRINHEASEHKIRTERALRSLITETGRVVSRATETRMALIGHASEARQELDRRARRREIEARAKAPALAHAVADGDAAPERARLASDGRGGGSADTEPDPTDDAPADDAHDDTLLTDEPDDDGESLG